MGVRSCILAVAVGLAAPGLAGAGNLGVAPVQVELSAEATSALVSLHNAGEEPVRYQVSLFAWHESPTGEMQLEPTQDVLVFPTLLSLAPGEQRNLRVGTITPFGDVEKTYRMFVEEMPPLATEAVPSRVRVLTRIGIPVFLEPAHPAARGELADLTLHGRRFSFRLRNSGNMRLRPQVVRAVARGGAGEILSDQKLDAWYVLAGGDRVFEAEVPKERCGLIRILSAEVALEAGTLLMELPVARGACVP